MVITMKTFSYINENGLLTFVTQSTKLNINSVNWTLFSHWLVNWFVVFGAPYMAQDIYAMYLSHFHIQKVRGHSSSHSSHSLQTVKAFLAKDWMLVLHHLVLLLIFMPITLVGFADGRSVCMCYDSLMSGTCVLLCSSSEEDWAISLSAACSQRSSALLSSP